MIESEKHELFPRSFQGVTSAANVPATMTPSDSYLPTHGVFAWPPRFFRRHDIAYQWENMPWSECDLLDHIDSPGEEISFFLRTDDESARYEGRIRPILDICDSANFDDLLEGDNIGVGRKMGWLIDGNCSNGSWKSRLCLGALSARELAVALLEKVMSCRRDDLQGANPPPIQN